MRALTNDEVRQVQGGNPLASGVIGAVGAGITEYSSGGSTGDVIFASTMGFATGTFGAIAWSARSVYYGSVAVGSAIFAGANQWKMNLH